MDYELKYVITIFLIVKIGALSPEFSISEEKRKPEQGHGLLEAPLSVLSSATDDSPGPSVSEPHRPSWGAAGSNSVGEMGLHGTKPKKIKENQSFDICEHKIELLESPLKWRNIQKTLRWLDRIFSSNHTNLDCGERKTHKRRSNSIAKTKNNELYQSKSGKYKSFFKRKKPKRERKLNDVPSGGRFTEEKKFKRKRIYKHRPWKTRSKTPKWKGFRYEKNHSNLPRWNATTSPKSVLFEAERIFLKRGRDRNAIKYDCLKSSFDSPTAKENRSGRKNRKNASQGYQHKPEHPAEGWAGEVGRLNPERKPGKQKVKPWPHFVYHRVSSNFIHPELAGHSHKQSAYIAISVATSSKPETTDNNVG